MDNTELTNWISELALQEGFSSIGVSPAVDALGVHKLDEWLASGYAGTMDYLADRREAYDHPRHVLDGVRSLVMLTCDYQTEQPAELPPAHGRVSRYAWGTADYHDLIHDRFKKLISNLRHRFPDAAFRGVVDSAPLLEREFAERAGLGWVGKHTLLLNRNQGSWFFLAALLTDLELDYNTEQSTNHCGTCTACLDVCPTDAFPQPYVLDASRCISYLTIEHREEVPDDLRSGIGEWLFGCDLCQEVCPWNRKSPESTVEAFQPASDSNPMELASLFDMDEDAFRARFRKTPLWRTKRRGVLRNAAIVLGNRPTKAGLPALERGLSDREALVRGASAWALGHYGEQARTLLASRLENEKDAYVTAEIQQSLARLESSVDQGDGYAEE